jgi:hypothetical protein
VGFGSVWLAGRNGALRLDPKSLRTVAAIPVRSLSVTTGNGAVWAFDPVRSTVRRIDPVANQVTGRPIRIRGSS